VIAAPRSSAAKPRIRMLIPLWGQVYFERWLKLAAPSLRSRGNVPYLQQHSHFELVFLTKEKDLVYIAEKMTREIGNDVAIKGITIDDFFPQRPISYGVPLTLAFTRGVQDLGAAGIGTFVILMNADFILSDGSLASLLQRIEQGYHIVTAPSIRVVDQTARRPMTAYLNSHDRAAGLPARFLMSLTLEHLHHSVLARIINEQQPIEAWYYQYVYWRLGPDCLAARYFLLHPFCFQLRRQVLTATCPIDYGFIEQVCPGGRYIALADSDEFLMVELQDRDAEAELLMPARPAGSADEALEQKITQIVAQAGAWSTHEHRRGFQQNLLFHSGDVSVEQATAVAEFNARITDVLDRMPPPVPWQRHMHWLGAIHDYRGTMTVDDSSHFYPDLLSDPVNRKLLLFFPIEQGSLTASAQDAPIEVSKYFTSAGAIVTLNGLAPDLAQKLPLLPLFTAKEELLHSEDLDGEVVLHNSPIFSPGHGLGIYLWIDSLPHWPKFQPLCDAVINAGAEVVVFFRGQGFTAMPFEGKRWVLSRLVYYFCSQAYSAQVEFVSPLDKSEAEATSPHPLSDLEKLQIYTGSISPLMFRGFVGFVVRLAPRAPGMDV
jgi:hypothetical protein